MKPSIMVLSLVMLFICIQSIYAKPAYYPSPPPPLHSPPPPPLHSPPPPPHPSPPPPPHHSMHHSPPPPPPHHSHHRSPPPPPPHHSHHRSPPPPHHSHHRSPPPPPHHSHHRSPPPPPPHHSHHHSPPPPPPSPPPPPPPSPPPPHHSPPPPPPHHSPPPPPMTPLKPLNDTALGQQQAICLLKTACCHTTLVCPEQCPKRKPLRKGEKGCFMDCSSKCEATCRTFKPNCQGLGALCYDPRFVGGDGSMFYFHGQKGGNFAIVSDDRLQINGHFIGSRPQGRKRDFTWVQALSVMFDAHSTLVIGAKRVSHWDDDVDSLLVKWDGEEISIPTTGDAEWRVDSDGRQVMVERTGDVNSVRVTVTGLVEISAKVVPITEEDNRVHKYQIPADDAFAHLEMQFKFFHLSDFVEGILGKTYRPGYVSPAKKGVFMPMLGGQDKYQTPSLDSPKCKVCRFERQSQAASS